MMRFGMDEGVEIMVAMLLLIGALPFLMYLLERHLDEPKEKPLRGQGQN
ncbi:hypothetical protein [Flexivirga alba]|uniref:Uncharacterized protein n=1 Tax=Flexivirga alba TaxID=702742 RepID=A0ABW2ACY4_9MICO